MDILTLIKKSNKHFNYGKCMNLILQTHYKFIQVLLEKCMYHSYCPEYDELLIVGDCINCGCAPSKHTCKTGMFL